MGMLFVNILWMILLKYVVIIFIIIEVVFGILVSIVFWVFIIVKNVSLNVFVICSVFSEIECCLFIKCVVINIESKIV